VVGRWARVGKIGTVEIYPVNSHDAVRCLSSLCCSVRRHDKWLATRLIELVDFVSRCCARS
jgi:hypothetical protein